MPDDMTLQAMVMDELAWTPNVDADFQVANGGFRQFRSTAFGGTVHYSGRGMTVDTKLDAGLLAG